MKSGNWRQNNEPSRRRGEENERGRRGWRRRRGGSRKGGGWKKGKRTEEDRKDDQIKVERQRAFDTNSRHKNKIEGKEYERK